MFERGIVVLVHLSRGFAGASPGLADGLSTGDPQQPDPKPGWLTQITEAAKGVEKRLLCGIGRRVFVAKYAPGCHPRRALIPRDQLRERLPITPKKAPSRIISASDLAHFCTVKLALVSLRLQ